MSPTLQHDTPTDTETALPLILRGTQTIPTTELPATDWDEALQILVIKGTDTPAHTVPDFIAGTTSTSVTDNIKDEDD
ncbi:hypothetical protein KDK95_01350 [Actinospica sp. MGRD01-02]|uniref:Uncharacterized protein n=1 Tax=Actinospica acidithermotolerans TaxID=2828514 RepID=A0A941E7M7_9ACTN|nr:hypothetical protein [Actinospica acidithermotolerans]MBR7824935.1 hypothetical protein [Actinospica acidithermotolerans]